MEFNLQLIDRLSLLGVLPQANDITGLKIVQDLVTKIGFTEQEFELYDIQAEAKEDGSVFYKWNDKGAKDTKPFTIGTKACMIIAGELERLNKQKQLTQQHVNIYNLFCTDEKTEGD